MDATPARSGHTEPGREPWLPHRLIVNPSDAASFNSRASLRAVFCRTCNKMRVHPYAALPDAEALPDDHPFLLKLRKLQRELDLRAEPLQPPVALRAQDSAAIPHDAYVRHARACSLESDEFDALATELRGLLELPAALDIRPGCRLGQLRVRLSRRLRAVDVASFLWVLVREQVVALLQQHGFTGWVAAPVQIAGTRAAMEMAGSIIELVVTGRAGRPLGQAGGRRCSECGHVRPGDDLFEFLVDPAQHDGSDIFRFDGDLRIFVTARLRECFEAAGYATEDANHVSMVDFRHGY